MKKITKSIKKNLDNEKGATNIIIMIAISFILIYNITIFSPAFFKQQDLTTLTKEIVEEIEYTGRIDENIYNKTNLLISKMKLNEDNVSYKFTGAIRSNGKIQFKDEFTVTMTGTKEITIANFFAKNIKVNFPLKKSLTGKSQVYYKLSEL